MSRFNVMPRAERPERTWNPFKRTIPPDYTEEFPVNLFEFWQCEARAVGGWRNLASMLIPRRYFDEDGTWRILGPRWNTRTCSESEEWCLFMIQKTKPEGEWTIEGLSR